MTTASYTYAGRDLPPRIQRAITRAMDPSFLTELNAAERVALAALLRRVEAVDGQRQFWVRRCNLAEIFGRVERTITNWLNALEEHGLIAKEQGRTRWGNFSCVTLHLTESAARGLGLATDSPPCEPIPKNISPGHKEGFTKEQPYQGHLALAGFSKKPVDKLVPEDCSPLLKLGVSIPGVFKLMSLAKASGKRLGDVIQCRLDAISKSNQAFAYVSKLLRDGTDYAAIADVQREINAQTAETKKLKDNLKEVKRLLTGKWVKGKTPGKAVRVQNSDDVPTVFDVTSSQPKYLQGLVGAGLIGFWEDMVTRYSSGQLQVFETPPHEWSHA